MNVSRALFGTAVLALVTSAAGCKVSVETKTRYVENVTATPVAWGGGPIVVDIQGVGVSINGGVTVTADPTVTDVQATARMLATAFEKPDADQSIIDAKATFTITQNGTGIDVKCGHGNSHGDSNGGESGCELVEIKVPVGSDAQKLNLTVKSGNGTVTLNLGSAVAANLDGNGKGTLNATYPGTPGATIQFITSGLGNDINAKLPANFAADTIILNGDPDPIDTSVPVVNKGPFTDIVDGAGRGTAGTGLAKLGLEAKDATINLASY